MLLVAQDAAAEVDERVGVPLGARAAGLIAIVVGSSRQEERLGAAGEGVGGEICVAAAPIARSVVCTSNWWPSSLSQPPSLRWVSASRLRADTSSHCSSPTSTRRSVAASQATSAGDIRGIRSASTAWMRADS